MPELDGPNWPPDGAYLNVRTGERVEAVCWARVRKHPYVKRFRSCDGPEGEVKRFDGKYYPVNGRSYILRHEDGEHTECPSDLFTHLYRAADAPA